MAESLIVPDGDASGTPVQLGSTPNLRTRRSSRRAPSKPALPAMARLDGVDGGSTPSNPHFHADAADPCRVGYEPSRWLGDR
jgi:hypothetical protein